MLGGHSIAQICLYAPKLKLLLTGDQLLERITPNIGVWPYGETDPLPRYLDSLRTIAALDIEHVLPAHHDVYHAGVKRTDWWRTIKKRCASSWRAWARGA